MSNWEPGHRAYHLSSGSRTPRPVTVTRVTANGLVEYIEGHHTIAVTDGGNLAVEEDIPNHPHTQRRNTVLDYVRWALATGEGQRGTAGKQDLSDLINAFEITDEELKEAATN